MTQADRPFVISHRRKGGTVYTGFDVIRARSEEAAIEAAQELWVENWNRSYPMKADGKTQIEHMEFGVFPVEKVKAKSQ